jgi:hypothetical protein
MLNNGFRLAIRKTGFRFAAPKGKKRRRTEAACFIPVPFGSPENIGEATANRANRANRRTNTDYRNFPIRGFSGNFGKVGIDLPDRFPLNFSPTKGNPR